MVTSRKRGERTTPNKLTRVDSKVDRSLVKSRGDATDSVTAAELAPDSTGRDALQKTSVLEGTLAPGSVNTEHLGSINKIFSDGKLELNPNDTVTLGGSYVAQLAGRTSNSGIGVKPNGDLVLADATPTGSIFAYPSPTPPEGYLLCDGSSVSKALYPNLYNIIGDLFGTGTTANFIIPNLQGRVPVGYSPSSGYYTAVGVSGGSTTKTLTVANMPEHTHVQNSHTHTQNSHNHTQDSHNHTQNSHTHFSGVMPNNGPYGVQNGSYYQMRGSSANASEGSVVATTATNIATTAVNNSTTAVNQSTTAVNQSTGSGTSFTIMNPFLVVHYIIKT